jgi:hypothetical protein
MVVLVALAVLDAGARRLGGYASTAVGWPAGWRAVPVGRRKGLPYREDAGRAWVLVARPGIPRAMSLFLPPAFGVVLLWCLATVLALGDFKDVAQGTRSLPFALASLSLCLIRAAAGGATLLGAWERRGALFFLAGGLALGLDTALACVELPCSDVRTDDVRMALAGGAVQAALILGFAVSLWRRRGLVASARLSHPPEYLPAEELPPACSWRRAGRRRRRRR